MERLLCQRALTRFARLGWIVLAVIHVPLLVAVAVSIAAGDTDAGLWASAGALALAIGLFTLKALDVRWLRLRARWQTLVALAVVTAIVHTDAVLAGAGVSAAPATIAVTSVIATRGAVRCGPRWIGAGRRLLAALLAAARPRLGTTTILPAIITVGAAVGGTRPAIPRAPPVLLDRRP